RHDRIDERFKKLTRYAGRSFAGSAYQLGCVAHGEDLVTGIDTFRCEGQMEVLSCTQAAPTFELNPQQTRRCAWRACALQYDKRPSSQVLSNCVSGSTDEAHVRRTIG